MELQAFDDATTECHDLYRVVSRGLKGFEFQTTLQVVASLDSGLGAKRFRCRDLSGRIFVKF